MTLLQSMVEAEKAVSRVQNEIRGIAKHRGRVSGGRVTFPFDHNDQALVKHHKRYVQAAEALGVAMRQLGALLPEDREYANTFGWAVALDELTGQVESLSRLGSRI